jgi:hypothetical protein
MRPVLPARLRLLVAAAPLVAFVKLPIGAPFLWFRTYWREAAIF